MQIALIRPAWPSGQPLQVWRQRRDRFAVASDSLIETAHRLETISQHSEGSGQVRAERVGPQRRQLATDRHRLLDRRQRLLPPPQLAQRVARRCSASRGQIRPERVGPLRRQLATGAPPPPRRRQRLLPPPQLAQRVRRRCSARVAGSGRTVGPLRSQLAIQCQSRPPPAPPPAAPGRSDEGRGC